MYSYYKFIYKISVYSLLNFYFKLCVRVCVSVHMCVCVCGTCMKGLEFLEIPKDGARYPEASCST